MFASTWYWNWVRLAVCATLVSSVAAEDRVSIRLDKGDEITYRRTITGDQDLDNAGFTMVFRYEHNQEFLVAVRDIDDGGYILDVTPLHVWGWDQIPFGEPERYDSAEGSKSGKNRFLESVGTTVRVRVPKNGQTVDTLDSADPDFVAVEFLRSALTSYPQVSLQSPEVWSTTIEEDITYSIVAIDIQHDIRDFDAATIEVRSSATRFTQARADTELQPIIGMLEAELGELGLADVTAEGSSRYSRADGLPLTFALSTRMSYGVRDKKGKLMHRKDFGWVLTKAEEITRVVDTGAEAD